MQLRQAKGLRQEDLAEKAGVSRQQVSRVERGLGDLSFESVVKVADFFDVTVAKLCEATPKDPDLQIDIRRSRKEKGDLKFSKVFSEAPKLRLIELNSQNRRKLQIQNNHIYDLLVLKGELIFTSDNYSDHLSANQALSIKGSAVVYLRSSSVAKKSEILVVQSFVK